MGRHISFFVVILLPPIHTISDLDLSNHYHDLCYNLDSHPTLDISNEIPLISLLINAFSHCKWSVSVLDED